MFDQQAGHGTERQPQPRGRLVQRHVFALAQGRVKGHDFEDLPPVQRVASCYRRGVADNPRDEPGGLVHIGDVAVRHGRPPYGVVAVQGGSGAVEPVARQDDVGVYSRDQFTLRRRDSRAPGVPAASIPCQVDQLDVRVARRVLPDHVCRAVT